MTFMSRNTVSNPVLEFAFEQPTGVVQKTKAPRAAKKGSLPLRDTIDEKLYLNILNKARTPKQQPLHYFRFQLYIILARHTGLRLSDVGSLTHSQVLDLLVGRKVEVMERKTRKFRKVVLSDKGRAELSSCSEAICFVFEKQGTLMGTAHPRNWARFVNTTLRKYTEESGLVVRSHSFRISYVTHLLNFYPIHAVSKIINHSSVAVTERYSRYQIDDAELRSKLNSL